ncbi:dTDP-4-dehydrorhamnose 3,5-epimerase [Thermogladius sp. 4427co]|uniref:dTDP-4-dehydrorhamnose 3,5-epimerase n=1 Tax=Thermogladius sp. 4427co TaxID=3450718 RepID=UPI003F7A0652
MPFKSFKRLEIPDVILVEYTIFPDQRGFFTELYKKTAFHAGGITYDFAQANLSFSRKNVVRGLHYQLKPAEQGKLVYVIDGRVYDVAVDIRRGSPWFGKYVGVVLEPGLALWIPPGFAHGFQALEDSYFLYLVTKEYSQQLERCILWDDPEIGINWPIREGVILSERDKKCPRLREAEINFEYPV